MFYAHSNDRGDKGSWQPLITHLSNVASLSRSYFGESIFRDAAYAQGLLHDAGKYSSSFQQKLDGKSIRVDHSTAGAQIALKKYGALGKLIAYSICGHHGGIPDGIDAGYENKRSSLKTRMSMETEPIDLFWTEVDLPQKLDTPQLNPTGFRLAFLTRMLFSALVDADYLDTEAFYDPAAPDQRSKWTSIDQLALRFEAYMEEKQANAEVTPINCRRQEIYADCLRSAQLTPGLFSLTVPTGGGKTLSSMAFGIKHALRHGYQRIVYAIPFTSIIEQTAAVFRNALGDNAVLEHHSNYAFEDSEDGTERLASENWDAPVIVTTNVQFFEALFSNKPSRCRKLHNLANSIIILDEVQTIPDGLLKPCLAALKCICDDFGATVVLCTATQPTIEHLWPEPMTVREIVSDPENLYNALRRVEVFNLGSTEDEDLVNQLIRSDQVLCIVNTRRHARSLFQMMPKDEGTYHLSALMCPEHRTQKLNTIRQRLKEGLPCRVISTQLIEAGVDIDFPVVYRSAAGIDSIAQAAGRCNREGKQDVGRTYVFYPTTGLPKSWFQRMAALGTEIMNNGKDPLSMGAVKEFFARRYMDAGRNGLDEHEIIRRCKDGLRDLDFPFEQIAREFRFIESEGIPIIVPFDDHCKRLLTQAGVDEHPWRFARRFQRYSISVYPYELEQLSSMGLTRTLRDMYTVLTTDSPGFRDIYNNEIGLNIEPETEVLLV